jgi:hypothetical protein
MLAVGIESAKYFFFFKGCLGDKDLGNGLRRTYLAIGVGCFIISIVATLSFGYNEAVTVNNNVSGNNQIAEMQKNDIITKSNQINNLQSQIKSLQAEKITEINKWDKYKHSSKRDSLATTYNAKIEKLNNQIDNLNATTTKPADVKTTKKENSGLATFFAGITMLGTPFERVFLIFFAILTELIGIFANIEYARKSRKILKQYTVYEDSDNFTPDRAEAKNHADCEVENVPPTLSQRLEERREKRNLELDLNRFSRKPSNNCTPEDSRNTQDSNTAISNEQPSNFHTPEDTDDCYNKNNIAEYLKYVYSNKQGRLKNESPGFDLIRENTGLTSKQIKGIRFYLEQRGIIEIKPNEKRTYFLVDSLNQALLLI